MMLFGPMTTIGLSSSHCVLLAPLLHFRCLFQVLLLFDRKMRTSTHRLSLIGSCFSWISSNVTEMFYAVPFLSHLIDHIRACSSFIPANGLPRQRKLSTGLTRKQCPDPSMSFHTGWSWSATHAPCIHDLECVAHPPRSPWWSLATSTCPKGHVLKTP